MAIKAKARKHDKSTKKQVDNTIQSRYSTMIHTEQVFAKMMLRADERGLLSKKMEIKAKNNMRGFIGVMQSKPNHALLHSSDNTHGKLRKLISCGNHHSPLQQQQDSSVRVNNVTKQFHVAQLLTDADSRIFGGVSGEMYTYILTVSRPNTHKGKLVADYTKLRTKVSKVMTALKDGARNKNGLQLVGGQYLGGFASHEVTVKEDVLQAKGVTKLYHPHTHILLISDAPLDVDATADVLYKKWDSINKDVHLSRKAFDLKPCYDKNDFKNGHLGKQNKVAAIKEAVKYTVKPDIWNKLDDINDSYTVEVFAELYNAVNNKRLKHSYGLLEMAQNFLTTFKKFENAMAFSILEEFPDIVTQLSELVFDPTKSKFGGYNAHYKRELTADEVVYYNRGLIEDILVTSTLEAKIEAFFDEYGGKLSSRKQLLYADAFKAFTFMRTGQDLFDRLERFASVERVKGNDLKAYDINLLSQSIETLVAKQGFSKKGCVSIYAKTDKHKKYVREEREKYEKLFHKNVGALHGVNATVENHNVFADFLKKQGFDPQFSYDSIRGTHVEVDLFVDAKTCSPDEVVNYLGVAFFDDVWGSVSK